MSILEKVIMANGELCWSLLNKPCRLLVWRFVLCIWITMTLHGVRCNSFTCPSVCDCWRDQTDGLKVDCTGQNLTSIPADLDVNTVKLLLSMTNISALPDRAFSDYKRLQRLHLTNNMLSSLPPNVFAGLKNLQYLAVQGNRLKCVPRKALRNLVSLETLYLDNNNITEVHELSFKSLRRLQRLRLNNNQLAEIPVKAINQAKALTALDISHNFIEEIPDLAFFNLTELSVLTLSHNRISHVGPNAFDGLPVLASLELKNNRLVKIPVALKTLPDLFDLTLRDNHIEAIPDGCFSGNQKLTLLEMANNPIAIVGQNAFAHLPELEELCLSEVGDMRVFPNLTGTYKLRKVVLDRAAIEALPYDFCHGRHDLTVLDLHSNHISVLPNMTECTSLIMLNLGNNDISSLDNRPFAGLDSLKDLILNYNSIQRIPDTAFVGLRKLMYLDLSYNSIVFIHEDAFSSMENLEDLNLGENSFPRLPTRGLKNLRNLMTFHNRYLQEPPSYEALPNIQRMTVAYAYHCCPFVRNNAQQPNVDHAFHTFDQEIAFLHANSTGFDFGFDYDSDYGNGTYNYYIPIYEPIYDDDTNCTIDGMNITNCTTFGMDSEQPLVSDVSTILKIRPPVDCSPMPDPFQPCDDLFGWWSLRCGVWVMFLLAVLGNGSVLFVSTFSKSKLDVTRFLICNLALSDLCMGVYLGFLAIIDASTLGEFEKYAVRWQSSAGCLVAGFLGVLSSELSVFTLVVITVERFYAISHAMQLGKRVRLTHAGVAMAFGWTICVVIASLPLFEVSDYRKFAICLPFETSDKVSLAYVCFIMVFNAICFFIIVVCYGAMFLSIRASHSWNANDTIVAKRMALLVFTDFFCWAPIIFFSLTAAFKWEIASLSLDEAKVLTIFVLPLNSCANPFLYAFFTRQFKRDCVKLCKRIEESSISRHLSSSGVGRSSLVQHRQTHRSARNAKRHSCDQLMNEPSTSGEPSSASNNASDDSDFTFRKLHLTSEEKQILRYVRSEASTARPVRLVMDDSLGNHLSLVPVRRSRNMASPQKGLIEDEQESGPDIVLHTNDGNVYLSSMTKTRKGFRFRKGNLLEGTNSKCAKRLCHYSSVSSPQSPTKPPLGSRSVESQTVQELPEPVDEKENSISKTCEEEIEEPTVFKKFEAERSQQLGLKTEGFGNKSGEVDSGYGASMVFRTIGTQTELNLDIPSAQIINLQRAIAKREKEKHINEWRKTSHLSFLWRHSAGYDAVSQKQKSNSLVELTRPITSMQTNNNKRHSLTSKHEGYILLKNTSRDSAYEDDELYEFYENRPAVTCRTTKPRKKSCTEYRNVVYGSDVHTTDLAHKETIFSLDSEDICETSKLLSDNQCLPKSRNSCDNESGISSSS